ncbi:MAG: HPr family phosphocarrier protein, partial [Aeromonas veronii]
LAMLNVRQGDQLTLLARGEDAAAALTCFQQLADERFGD